MIEADRVLSTPRRTAPKIKATKRARKSNLAAHAAELKAIDGALTRMHIEYEDDADSRQDYLKLAARRRELLQIFGSTPALSRSDVEAKALALSQRETLEDYTNTALIAASLAKDILTAGEKLIVIEDDRPATSLPRAEQIVELLTTCYVREGWKIDKAAAKRALAYVRKYAKDGSDRTRAAGLQWIFSIATANRSTGFFAATLAE